jgi:heptose I phosphotransferase
VSLEDFCREWPEAPPAFPLKLALIQKVADIARSLHQNGVNHRDFYLCHFLLERNSLAEKPVRIFLIDLHRVQIREHTPLRWIIKDLGGLFFSAMEIGLTRRDLFRFMKAYRQRSLAAILKDETDFWARVRSRAESLYKKHAAKQVGSGQGEGRQVIS